MSKKPVKNCLSIGDLVSIENKDIGEAVAIAWKCHKTLMETASPMSDGEIRMNAIDQAMENMRIVANNTNGMIVEKPLNENEKEGALYGVLVSENILYVRYQDLHLLKKGSIQEK